MTRDERRRANAESQRRYASTARGREVHRLAVATNRRRWPERESARTAVRNALKRGDMERPAACPECGEARTVEAHHWLGYDKEYWLDIHWLCSECHRKEHRGAD